MVHCVDRNLVARLGDWTLTVRPMSVGIGSIGMVYI